VFNKNNKRLKRKLLTKIHNRVDIRRIRFDRNSRELRLPTPLPFSSDLAFQDPKRHFSSSLHDYDLGKLSYGYDKHLAKLRLRKMRLRKIKKLYSFYLCNSDIF